MKAILAGAAVLAMAGSANAATLIQYLSPNSPYNYGVTDANISPWNTFNDHNGSWMMGSSGNLVGLLRFDLPSLPGGSVVDSAKLQLYSSNNYNAATSVDTTAYALLRDWSEANVNWQNYDTGLTWTTDGASGAGSDYKTTAAGAISFMPDAGYTDMDITAQYQQWYSGAENNYGLVLKPDAANAGILYVGDVDGSAAPFLVVQYHAVPEPAAMSLLSLAGLMALRRGRSSR